MTPRRVKATAPPLLLGVDIPEGCISRTPANKPICYGYNRGLASGRASQEDVSGAFMSAGRKDVGVPSFLRVHAFRLKAWELDETCLC